LGRIRNGSKENQSKEDIMVQYLENVLRYNRVSGWKSGLERVRMFFDATPSAYSKEKADGVDCNEDTKTWREDMEEKLGGW
jgi:hypothetical protein